jgi:hypothetical protein
MALTKLMTEAARRLEGAYPLAATLLLRAMVQHALTYGIATRYKAAAKHCWRSSPWPR